MYRDRLKTRDLLLEYDRDICPPRPRQAGLDIIYPWENYSLTVFARQLFELAANSGYDGTEQEFITNFGSYLTGKEVYYSNYDEFPETGEVEKLYFALDEKILYYCDENDLEYKPVKATLIEDTILYNGDATDI